MNDRGDPFEYDDAAYVLGAMSSDENAAFERHLRGCAACTARVQEVQDIRVLLAEVSADHLTAANEPVPDTLLPMLVRRAQAERRRGRRMVTGLAAVAAACLIALIVVLWPTRSSQPGPATAARPFVAVTQSPVRATAMLTAKAWGTAIDVHCRYADTSIDKSFRYDLVVYGRDGSAQTVGSWQLPPGREVSFPAGTALPQSQIAKIEIRLPDGRTILRLTA